MNKCSLENDISSAKIIRWKNIVDVRKITALQDNLNVLREGKGSSLYGAHCSAVLGMPHNMITENDIRIANADVRKVTNYLDVAKKYDTSGGRGEIDFVAIRIVRLLFIDQNRIEPETHQALKKFFLTIDFQSPHKSENHMFMSRVSRYLAACYYKNEWFEQYKMTAEEIRRIDCEYLSDFMRYRAKRGWAEFNSFGYEVHNFNSLIALYDCALDSNIKRLAEMTMEIMLLTMIENTTINGIYGGAHGRSYGAVVNDLKTGIYWLNMLYFGCGDFENCSLKLKTFSEPYILISDWKPSEFLYTVYENKKFPILAFERTHNHTLDWQPKNLGFINKYTYSTNLYSIGCINQQDSFPENEAWYEEHQQTNWSLVFANNSKASITTHHPGNDGLHAYWYGDLGCCCNHLFGNKNIVIGIYYIPNDDESQLNFIHAYVPKEEFDEILEKPDNKSLFLRLGDVYVALKFSHKYSWGGKDENSEIIIYDDNKTTDIRIAFSCEVSDINESHSFENFISKIEQKDFVFSSEKLNLIYGNMNHTVIPNKENKMRTDEEIQYINEEQLKYPYRNTYFSSIMKSEFDSGIFEIYSGKFTKTMDFNNATVEYRERK